jgi:hypothetical protein
MQENIKQQIEAYIKLLNITLSDNPKHYELSDWIPNCIECLQFALDNEELLVEKPSLYADMLSTMSLLYSWIVEDESWAYIELRQKFRTVYTPKQMGNALKIMCERMKESRDEVIEANYKTDVINSSGCSIDSLYRMVQDGMSTKDALQKISDMFNEANDIKQEPTIEQLKKQIKYSKNPLEVKMLNKKLNQMYKDQKRR